MSYLGFQAVGGLFTEVPNFHTPWPHGQSHQTTRDAGHSARTRKASGDNNVDSLQVYRMQFGTPVPGVVVPAATGSSHSTPHFPRVLEYPGRDTARSDASIKPEPHDTPKSTVQFELKPECWEHGCNGRLFLTFSSLLQHQRQMTDPWPDTSGRLLETIRRHSHRNRAEPTSVGEDQGSPQTSPGLSESNPHVPWFSSLYTGPSPTLLTQAQPSKQASPPTQSISAPLTDHEIRFSRYQYAEQIDLNAWPEQSFQTNKFKNSHFNTAHYNNPNFQPEEYRPDHDYWAKKPKRLGKSKSHHKTSLSSSSDNRDHGQMKSDASTPTVPTAPSFSTIKPMTCHRLSIATEQVRLRSVIHEKTPPSNYEAASAPAPSLHLPRKATSDLIVDGAPTEGPDVLSDENACLDLKRMSCDMSDRGSLETCSSSEGPSSPVSLAEARRKVLIDGTISWMVSWVDSKLAVLAFQTHGSQGDECTRKSSSPQANTGGNGKGLALDRRKGSHEDRYGSGDEDGDGEDCVPPPSQDSRDGDIQKISEFACPFLKHNPRKYELVRSCSATGWKAIFRLKEHLYRCHQVPSFRCIRCCKIFKSSEQLLEHSQAEVACNVVRDESAKDGISHEQLLKLKSKKRNREASSDHDKWIQMYKILFPDDYLIPSPYFQRGDSGKGQESLLTALREHVGRELPRLIRPRLEESVDATIREALGPDMLEGLVRDIFAQVLSTFPRQTSKSSGATSGENDEKAVSPMPDFFPQLALPGSDGLAILNVPSFGTEQNASASWVLSQKASIEQPESSQQASQRIHHRDPKWQNGIGDPSEMTLWTSNYVSGAEPSYLSSTPMNGTAEGPSLGDLFNFEDFHDEYAAWLGQSDEGSSRADSGYYSLQSVDSMDDLNGKEKGKEVVRE